MAFHDVRLPEDVEQGAIGGPAFKTTILELSSGHERRNIDWERTRASYDLAYGIMSLEDNLQGTYINLVRDFFYAREGRAHGFRFKDWSDFEISRQTIGQTDTTTSEFQIFKRYSSGGIDYDRTITAIVSGTVSVWVNNVSIAEGAGAGEYQIDLLTGIITLGSTLAAQSGTDVEVECEFDVPCRFQNDQLRISLRHAAGDGAGSIPSIPIREIRPEEA